MIKYIIIAGFCFSGIWVGTQNEDFRKLNGDQSVQNLLERLGDEKSQNYADLPLTGSSIDIGESIVLTGRSRNMFGGKTKKQSKHFVCTSCHNVEQESAFLNIEDPQERLEYTDKMGLPFLQGSPLFGIVNRTSFYNDDYKKKYGDLVDPARDNIREAIQLCAIQCSQGRALKDWELESVLSYLWTLELRVKNLVFTEQESMEIEMSMNGNGDKDKAIQLIKSKYLDYAPAHFTAPPENRKEGIAEITPNTDNGKKIFKNSCLFCHYENDYSFFEMNDEKVTFKQLKKNMGKYDHKSVYQVVRYGTEPLAGKKAYMPHFPLEKMSLQQMEDLRAYIYMRAE